jgi:hypothetical protein
MASDLSRTGPVERDIEQVFVFPSFLGCFSSFVLLKDLHSRIG